ncbi:hypothetical protein HYH03_012268 [Edaphochlamys debaryana]|uniref:Uncharacterized protein n=1 Tax=Edaphochlamys debaryana TaxID=47281 RepID=A0A835XUI3_9CHLO|nr:hypothetical protein HYH03_012268 [Edaphochlamys debaryana]|eukprot:KAG2489248.1 hypothetical protein HYH03_012268 [Edaphochlamys debaryana]
MALSIASARGSPAASRRPATSTARGAHPAILPSRHRLSPASARCSAQPPPSGSGASASTSVTTTPSASAPPARSSAPLLQLLAAAGADPAATNVYGKPFTKSELSALQAAVTYLSSPGGGGAAAASEGPSALRGRILELMKAAATRRSVPLPVVEGGMVLLELMATAAPNLPDPGLAAVAPQRWMLVVGADVGAVQYIPAVEELEAPPGGDSFTLGTDLDFIFTGFRGPSKWLAPGHLSYTVRHVRIEARTPKAWRRAARWLAWRGAGGQAGSGSSAPAGPSAGPDFSGCLPASPTCREDPAAPAVDLGLPFFPANEIKAFACDGVVAATRSRLGGLILLLEVGAREEAKREAGVAV